LESRGFLKLAVEFFPVLLSLALAGAEICVESRQFGAVDPVADQRRNTSGPDRQAPSALFHVFSLGIPSFGNKRFKEKRCDLCREFVRLNSL